MKYKIIWCLFGMLSWSSISGQTDSMHVLLLGNSYTYFWNLPKQINAMASSQHVPLRCEQSTRGGVNLGQHWRGERGMLGKEKIQSGKYNHVVLQDHSMSAFLRPDSLHKYGELFGDLIQAANAQAYLYLTWARKHNPLMQQKNNDAYQQLAQKINAKVLPVGPAWARSMQLRPELDLYHPDGSHPSIVGTYLTACVIYGVLTKVSPLGLPGGLYMTEPDGSILFLNSIPMADAHFLQQVAWETITLYDN